MPEIILGLIVGAIIFVGAFSISKLFASSPRTAIAGSLIVIAGLIGFLVPAPWLLILDAIAIVTGIVLADALWRRGHYLRKLKPGGVPAAHLALLNPVRKAYGQSPLWLIPDHGIDADERDMVEHANRLAYEIRDAVKESPLSSQKRSSFQRQAGEVPDNLVQALWKLARLRRIAGAIDQRYDEQGLKHQELEQMVNQLRGEMQHSVEVLSSISISLVRVQLAHDDLATDRLLADLNESNQRLRDLSASYHEVREQRHEQEKLQR
ncbi:MAG TPA: hypothetical protein VMP08_05905 [Anaerolineae bacterium]|nr:hypothetical protein [Anaerolineae bacterium]